jgi:hypothetical protein
MIELRVAHTGAGQALPQRSVRSDAGGQFAEHAQRGFDGGFDVRL